MPFDSNLLARCCFVVETVTRKRALPGPGLRTTIGTSTVREPGPGAGPRLLSLR